MTFLCTVCHKKPLHSRGMCGTCYNRTWRNDEDFATKRRSGCEVDGCTKPHMAQGYCMMHYMRIYRNGNAENTKPRRSDCSVDGCSNKHYGHGYCRLHYERWYNNGTPELKPRTKVHVTKTKDRVALLCIMRGCLGKHEARGYCKKHYDHLRRKGTWT